MNATRDGPREATVSWEPPISLEKSDLIGYIVEVRESPDIKSCPPSKWTRVGPTVKNGIKLRLSELNPLMDVQFRVLTRTDAGLSEPSVPTDWLPKPKSGGDLLT